MAKKLFTRAEVAAQGSDKANPLLIIHNKVYSVASWLPDHPGGEEILMQYAGKDATKEYDPVMHSPPAQAKREEYLVGELVAADQSTYENQATKRGGASGSGARGGGGPSMDMGPIIKGGGAVLAAALYVNAALSANKIPSSVTYSALVRHAHTLMSIGAFGSIGSITMALNTADTGARRGWMDLHKGTGVMMAIGILVRVYARLTSAIPPRFQSGSPALERAETLSHTAAYLLLCLLPASGLTYSYLSGTSAPLPFLGRTATPAKAAPTDQDLASAKSWLEFHSFFGKVFEIGFVPFHLAVTAYHFSNGKDVVKKISPFI